MTISKTADEVTRSLEYIHDYAEAAGQTPPATRSLPDLNMNIDDDLNAAFSESHDSWRRTTTSPGPVSRSIVSALSARRMCASSAFDS